MYERIYSKETLEIISSKELNELGNRYHEIMIETGKGNVIKINGEIHDDRTEEQVEIINRITTSMLPVLEGMAFSLKIHGRYNPYYLKNFPTLLGISPKKSNVSIEELIHEGATSIFTCFGRYSPHIDGKSSVYNFILYRATNSMIMYILKNIPNGMVIHGKLKTKSFNSGVIGGVAIEGLPYVEWSSLEDILSNEEGKETNSALEIDYLTSNERDPEGHTISNEMETFIPKIVEKLLSGLLNPREKNILERRRGLSGYEITTLEKLGEEYGITRERVRQIQVKAEKKLRKKYQEGLTEILY